MPIRHSQRTSFGFLTRWLREDPADPNPLRGHAMKKFSKAVIHLGGPKTGSTILQRTLDASRNQLLRAGLIAYPEGSWHAQLGSCFASKPAAYVYNVLAPPLSRASRRRRDRRYLKNLTHWLDAAPPCEALVISYEGFPDLDPKGLLRLRNFCREWAARIQAVHYVREPISYATSAYSQSIQFGILPEAPPIAHHQHQLEKIAGAFFDDSISVREWRPKDQSDWCVVSDFLAAIGHADARQSLQESKANNQVISAASIAFGKGVIGALEAARQLPPANIFYERIGSQFRLFPGDRFSLTSAEADDVRRRTSDQNQYLTDNWGVHFAKSAPSAGRGRTSCTTSHEQLGRHFAAEYLKNQPAATRWGLLQRILKKNRLSRPAAA